MGDGEEQPATPPGDHETTVTPTTPPPPPVPSNDPRLVSQAMTPRQPTHFGSSTALAQELFQIAPLAALRMLGTGVEALVKVTGDIPPTPPPTSPTYPNMSGMVKEKAAIVRSHSNQNLARVLEKAAAASKAEVKGGFFEDSPTQLQEIDGVHLRASPPPSAVACSSPPEPYVVIGANSQPLNLQHSAITRRFYSKKPPPISVGDYLHRIHQYCPMSTAVYLATSYYISRLAIDERTIAVTGRNCHRLLLAGLRVAMKALEDLSYPHAKFARVGGVSELELARLEINFCFLAGFELMVGEEVLMKHWESLKKEKETGGLGGTLPALQLTHRRKISAQGSVG